MREVIDSLHDQAHYQMMSLIGVLQVAGYQETVTNGKILGLFIYGVVGRGAGEWTGMHAM